MFNRVTGNDRDIITYGDFLRDVVQERLERVPGIGGVNIFGETEREMQIVVDPARLARYGMTVDSVIARLRAANAPITGGDVDDVEIADPVLEGAKFGATYTRVADCVERLVRGLRDLGHVEE